MAAPEFVVDFPTLGDLADGWISQHCRVPDGFTRGKAFIEADWQFWCTANRYRIRDDAQFVPPEEVGPYSPPVLNQAFYYRQTLIVAPQKTGKGPWSASQVAFEACGPSVFGGWAKAGDAYHCEDDGCGCGWVYQYLPGEPRGMRHPSPLIQITATSEDQADNIYRPLKAMIKLGPLSELMRVREGFIRILGLSDDDDLDRIDVVTSSANSRLGNPISDAEQDEAGLYTKANKMIDVAETQRRGAAGMGGRTHATTNSWDPAMDSYAQRVFDSGSPDIFVFYRDPDKALRDGDGKRLSYLRRDHRHKIHTYVYQGSWWVNLDSIEAEAVELIKTDPAQAERFFGNRRVQGLGTWLPDGLWESTKRVRSIPDGTEVCGGFDGSDSDDWTAIRLETYEGYRFTPTYGPDSRPTIWKPQEWGGTIPRGEVHAAVAELNSRYKLRRFYCDTRDWQSEIGDWALEYGSEVVLEWATYRIVQMHEALVRSLTDLKTERSTHDLCKLTEQAAGNARKVAKPGDRYILGKPSRHQKIDPIMADTLAHEAAADAREAGWNPNETGLIYTASSTRAMQGGGR
jgi:hypothetical protein